MNGRFFGGKKIEAFHWDGKMDFNKVVTQKDDDL